MPAALAEKPTTSSLDAMWHAFQRARVSRGEIPSEPSPNTSVVAQDSHGGILSPYVKCRAGIGQRVYIGSYLDTSTNLNYLNARYYNPTQGQFLTQDPVFLAMGKAKQGTQASQDQRAILTNPQDLNPYSYAEDNPITQEDPSGNLTQAQNQALVSLYNNFGSKSVAGVFNAFGGGQLYSAISNHPYLAIGATALTTAAVTYLSAPAIVGAGAYEAITAAAGTAAAECDELCPAGEGAASGNTYEAIGSTGKVGENALQTMGGESQVYFQTSNGPRVVDQLVNGVANESKVGYTSLTQNVSNQIAKDLLLINSGQVQGVTWNFFTSPVTNLGGPSAPLQNALDEAGFNTIIHN